MTALLIVDLQNDFFPGGPMGVPKAEEILPVINDLLDMEWDLVVASQDWHPESHGSFAAVQGKPEGEMIKLKGVDQVLWPVHCVQKTTGAELVQRLKVERIDKVVKKGTNSEIDSYSTFFDNKRLKSTGLEKVFRYKSVNDLVVVGLATDYCVKYSVLDALELGFQVTVIPEGCKAINLRQDDEKEALEQMERAGAKIVSYADFQRNV